MEKITVDIYRVDELSKEARAKVLAKHRYWNVETFPWHEEIISEAVEELNKDGISLKAKELEWDLDHNLLKFSANVDLDRYPSKILEPLYEAGLSAEVTVYGRAVDVSVFYCEESALWDSQEQDKEAERIRRQIESDAESFTAKLLKDLRDAFDDLTSDESIIESLNANDCRFFVDGSPVPCSIVS